MELQTATVKCPGCQSGMQVWHIEDVEIDRCIFCGGIWFDRGEIGQALGKGPLPDPVGEGARSCPQCQQALGTISVEGLTLDGCRHCGGAYFDHEELDQLAGQKVKLESESDRNPITYNCPGCKRSVRHGEGYITAAGYACHICAPSLYFNVPGSGVVAPPEGGGW